MKSWNEYGELLLRLEPGEAPALIEAETKAVEKIGAQMNHVPLDSLDPITADEAASLEKILQLLAAATPTAPIYVHCEHGKDRTGLVLALYRIRYAGWSQDKAATEMAEMGHSGHLDHYFTGNMDVRRVLAIYPSLGPLPPPPAPMPAPSSPTVAKP